MRNTADEFIITQVSARFRNLGVTIFLFCLFQTGCAARPFPSAKLHASTEAAPPQIPRLVWQSRSDWVNVKKDGGTAAVGDGVHDDTAALQAAFGSLRDTFSGPHVLYFPPGTYRITDTLTLTKIFGALIIGSGRDTRIVWDGPAGGIMYHSDGASRTREIGIVWDGEGKAAVGVDHRSSTYYDTRDRHQDEAFLNFTEAGIRIGYQQNVPTAEVMYRNCLFQKCATGIALLEYNDYNNDIAQCDFRDCGTAVNCPRGNVYVRDCHFERSRTADIFLGSQSHSVRRCTSVGSRKFIETAKAAASLELMVQDCRVDGWTGTDGAVTLAMRGPTILFDTSFTHPPDSAPPVRLLNSFRVLQLLAISNNASPGASALVDKGPNGEVMQIPPGRRGGSLTSSDQSFLQGSRPAVGEVFDVRTEFGAKGDGQADDTQAILAAVRAARSTGHGAIAYLPAGRYNVSQSIPIIGSHYTVGGSGYATLVIWKGAADGVVFAVRDPNAVTLEQMRIIAADDSVVRVQQTSAGGASSVTYDGIYVHSSFLESSDRGGINGHILSPREVRALECVGLPAGAVVHIPHFDGTMRFINCGAATILGDFTLDGVVHVSGSAPATGFLGLQTHVAAGNPCDIVVEDNGSMVIGDLYSEQTQQNVRLAGGADSNGPPGRVTIRGVKVYTYDPVPISIDNYRGRFTYCGAHFVQTAYTISHRGSAPAQMTLLGNTFFVGAPRVQAGSAAGVTVVQNIVTRQAVSDPLETVPKRLAHRTLASGAAAPVLSEASEALDDFRELGALDLRINGSAP